MTSKFRAVTIACAMAVLAAGGATAEAHLNQRSGTDSRVKVTGGETTLTLNDASKTAFAGQGIVIAPLAPATSSSVGSFTFPIAGGRVDKTTLFGFVKHRGGVSLTKGDHKTKLGKLVIVNGPRGAALYGLSGHRFRLGARIHHRFARASHLAGGDRRGARRRFGWRWHIVRLLALTNLQRTDQAGKVIVTADAALTERGAKFLNRKLDTTLFSAGQAIGTVTVTATG